jgi:uncharacterized protein
VALLQRSGTADVGFRRCARAILCHRGPLSRGVPGRRKAHHGALLEMPDGPLRIAGIISALVGILIVWLVRG